MLFAKTALFSLSSTLFLGLALLIPAERWYWLDAIIFLIIYFVLVWISYLYLCVFHPLSYEARFTLPVAGQPIEDKFASVLLTVTLVSGLILIPLDVFRFQLFSIPSLAIKYVGLAISILGYLISILAIAQNKFAQPIVNIQIERGQSLIDSGLYAHIRHPMYAGIFLWFAGMALWLGSLFMAVFGTTSLVAAFTPRFLIEEKTLKRELAGYADYMNRVKCRIVPKWF